MNKPLVDYLGSPAATILHVAPFNRWRCIKKREKDLELIYYDFLEHGLSLSCDNDDRIRSIFLDVDACGVTNEYLPEIPFSSSRQQVRDRMGSPSRSGSRHCDPFIGKQGPHDLFERAGYAVNVAYKYDVDRIRLITLMRADVVPRRPSMNQGTITMEGPEGTDSQ